MQCSTPGTSTQQGLSHSLNSSSLLGIGEITQLLQDLKNNKKKSRGNTAKSTASHRPKKRAQKAQTGTATRKRRRTRRIPTTYSRSVYQESEDSDESSETESSDY
nr:MAG: ORF3 [Giant panda anellovirus]